MDGLDRRGQDGVLRDWRAFSYAALRLAQFAPAGEARLVPDGALITTGESIADWNCAFVYGHDDPEGTLRAFVERIHRRAVPAYIFVASAVASRVRSTAEQLGLARVDDMPLMMFVPLRDPAIPLERRPAKAARESRLGASSSERGFDVRVIHDAETLALGRAVLAEAFGNPASRSTASTGLSCSSYRECTPSGRGRRARW